MKELGYGQGYQYRPGSEYNITTMECMPDSLGGRRYYDPTSFGEEAAAKEALEKIMSWKKEMKEKQKNAREKSPADE